MKQLASIIVIIFMTINAISQESMARLIVGLDSAELTINNTIQGKVFKNEKFLTFKHDYEATYWPVWTKTGQFGFIDKNKIVLLANEKIFKMNTDTTRLFALACSKHSTDNFSYFNIDYCKLVKSAAKGDEKSFLKILTIYKELDGAAAETHPEITWGILNLWSDSNFNKFLNKQEKDTQIIISEYLVYYPVSAPITDFEYYYSEYYPMTWKTIKNLIEIKKRE